MEPNEDDELWDISGTLARKINAGGYGTGYVKSYASINPKNILKLENPEKLVKMRRPNMMLFFVEPSIEVNVPLRYKWRVEDVLGQKGSLEIHRVITEREADNKRMVLFQWDGDESGSDWISVDRVKDPNWILDYIESCLSGKHQALPF